MAVVIAKGSISARSLPILRLTGSSLLILTLAGCASFSPDGGMTPVAGQVSSEIGASTHKIDSPAAAEAADTRVKALLAKPITAESAAQIALLSNRGLQAEYNALGITEASYIQASLPPNPSIGLERVATGGSLEIERRVVANLLSLITLPQRSAIAKTQFEAARQRAIEATFRTAADARRAFYKAVASRQIATSLEQARGSVGVAAELTKKMGETGAASKLDQARASAFYAELSNDLARARMSATADREALTRALGLWGADINYRLPARLPAMPPIQTAKQVEADAVRKRVDLIAARLELDATAKTLGLSKATRFVSMLDGGLRSNTEKETTDGITERSSPIGFEIDLQIPIFDLGETNVRRSKETYMQAVNHLMEKAVNVRSEAREAYATYRGSYDVAQLYQARILPLRNTINEQALLQYNGMLIDVFELLTTAREGIESDVAAIAARRDFFLASVDFQTSVIGGRPGSSGTRMAASAPDAD
ncbi:copper tolerance protein [Kaistia sp. 32K]|nr:copper tolerance protein [Kaistia sp. 32K]